MSAAASAAPIGVLALQGDVREHVAALRDVGASAKLLRRPDDLDGVSGLILPGGESTTLSLLLGSSGLFDPLAEAIRGGLPTFGTCAGLVLLAAEVLDGRPDQRGFALLQCRVRRNGYGRQLESFESTVELRDGDSAERTVLPAVFIRAPVIESVGPGVEVLGTLETDGEATPVVVREGTLLASSFHPELTTDRRLHRLFVSMVHEIEISRAPSSI